MKLLLDTHIWIWSHIEPERLATKIASLLVDASNELWLSPISVWEFMILASKGRIAVAGDPEVWVEKALSRAPMTDAALDREVAVRSRTLELAHDDPADRFLAATAAVYDLTLITSDARLLRAKGFRTLANRPPRKAGGRAR